jgi:hypothetical protein
MRPAILGVLIAGALCGPAHAAAPGWKIFADCSAAYLANARIADPSRPAAMKAQVSDVADDYAKAARARYRRQTAGSSRAAARAVDARIAVRLEAFAAERREVVEHVIDGCPQLD